MTDFVLPVLGPLAWIDVVLLGWFALTAASVAYVAWDTFVRGNPDFAVMKWGWVLVTLYMGPIAAALYVFSDKEPRPGTHARSFGRSGSRPWAPPSTVWRATPRGSSWRPR